MGHRAGSIKSISIAGTSFSVADDADVKRNLGGVVNKLELNGDGSARVITNRVGWKLEGAMISIDDIAGTQELLQAYVNAQTTHAIHITYSDDTVYSGTGVITESVDHSCQSGTASVTLMGGGILKKQ